MQCRLLRGLAGALLTLLCMGLLSLRYHSSLSPQGVRETPGLSPPSPLSPKLRLHDVFIAVKTTRAFHRSRLELLLDTWVSRTREQVTNGQLWAPGVGPGLRDPGNFSLAASREKLPAHLPNLGLSSHSSFLLGPGAPEALPEPLTGPAARCSSGPLLHAFQGPGRAPAPGSQSLLGVPLVPGCSSTGFASAHFCPAWPWGLGGWCREAGVKASERS